ncbi:zinc finger protein 134-like isoform X3 [Dunckerocampus dactyliophorus]|uniref:zinc finger protein 134-like isoform X3 n=1 Tax=Dunckerocampus dactyliophorus TaxID=161453 RepID=UPI002405D5F9|nr:zinc finger protein 134-like isoform X3 [Dunckerocampus dactyliophorus]
MSTFETLKLFVSQRLNAAVEEIFEHFERTIVEYEEEVERRHQKLLGVPVRAEMKPPHEDVQQLLLKTEDPSFSFRVEQQEPQPPHMKMEEEELDISKFHVKSEEDDEAQVDWSQPHHDCSEENRENEASHHKADYVMGPPARADGDWSSGTGQGLTDAHPHIKPFTCSLCGKTFSRKSYLTKHLKVHSGEKLFSCSLCDKRFKEHRELVSHFRVHTGEKPFRCAVCHKCFRYSGHVSRHMRLHTAGKL